MSKGRNLQKWLDDFVDNTDRIVLDLDMDGDAVRNSDGSRKPSPFIIVRHGGRVMILNPMAMGDHLCVDVHSFIDGEDATAGVFGMSDGMRWAFDDVTGTTSHGWNSTSLVSVLLGDQGRS